MELTDVQKAQISWELDAWKNRRDAMAKTYTLANPRMRKLWDQELYLEMVLVHSQVIEHYIKLILVGHGFKRRILTILSETDPYSEVNLDPKDDETLGVLIGILRRFTGKTTLIERLSRFNNQLRREVAHHIFDGSKDIAPLENEIKEYFNNAKGIPYTETMVGLKEVLTRVDKEILELSKERV